MPAAMFPMLRDAVRRTFILACKEDTTRLEQSLREEGLPPVVLRPGYTELEMTYSRTIRCLLNHASAWKLASEGEGLSLVVEADFVPCRGFGALPLPFDPAVQGDAAWAFLYAGGPRISRRFPDGSLQGHASCPVACVVSPRVGVLLCEYAREELKRHGDLTRYSLWDTQFQRHLMGRGAVCFMPWRQYGEHGGLPNTEHGQAGVGWSGRHSIFKSMGMGRNHHADVLYAPPMFLPPYARGSIWRYRWTRWEAKITGWLKLLTGRMVQIHGRTGIGGRLRLFAVCAGRLVGPY